MLPLRRLQERDGGRQALGAQQSAADIWTTDTQTQFNFCTRHSDMGNSLFVDGYVKAMKHATLYDHGLNTLLKLNQRGLARSRSPRNAELRLGEPGEMAVRQTPLMSGPRGRISDFPDDQSTA